MNSQTVPHNYFQNCSTNAEAHERLRVLAKQLHPDRGGSDVEMRAVLEEYKAFRSRGHNDPLSDEALASKMNALRRKGFSDPVLYRSFLARPNLVEYYHHESGHTIATRAQAAEYRATHPKPSPLRDLIQTLVEQQSE